MVIQFARNFKRNFEKGHLTALGRFNVKVLFVLSGIAEGNENGGGYIF